MITQSGVFIANSQFMKCQSCKKHLLVSELMEIASGWHCPGDCLMQGLEESVIELSKPARFCLQCHLIMDDEVAAEKERVKNKNCVDCTKERVSGHIRCQNHYLRNKAMADAKPLASDSRKYGTGKYAI